MVVRDLARHRKSSLSVRHTLLDRCAQVDGCARANGHPPHPRSHSVNATSARKPARGRYYYAVGGPMLTSSGRREKPQPATSVRLSPQPARPSHRQPGELARLLDLAANP